LPHRDSANGGYGGSSPDDAMRSPDRLRVHYEVEKELAARLRATPREQRLRMLTACTLKHPLNLHSCTSADGLLGRFLRPRMTVMEIAPGDCALSFELTKHGRQVHAVDVDEVLPGNVGTPQNFRRSCPTVSAFRCPRKALISPTAAS